MNYSKIEISGIRGFSQNQILNFAIPNGNTGSGLTVIVGPNNSGKSTIYEAIRAISSNTAPGFSKGQRNRATNGVVKIKITKSDSSEFSLETTKVNGGSETQFNPPSGSFNKPNFFTLPSRRGFAPFFFKDVWDRKTYIESSPFSPIRSSQTDSFFRRLFNIQSDPIIFETYNLELTKVLGYTPKWCIELSDSQQHYLSFENNGNEHNSDGAGEGFLSIFTIVDALYDSKPDDLIFIDEPELSLHPSLQKRLLNLLMEYSSTRQIIISTHSPYFINWKSLENNGKIARTLKDTDGTKIYQLQQNTTNNIIKLLNDLNNPHTLGLDAKEAFFLEDNVVLVEGQEDVIFFNKILEVIGINMIGDFYGWGIGGADKAEKILDLLNDLGFKKVVVIFDNNKKQNIPSLSKKFPQYFLKNIPTDDVRDKKEKGIEGLIDFGGKTLNVKHEKDIKDLFNQINTYFNK